MENEVVIEQVTEENPNLVSVIQYDVLNRTITGDVLEVCSRQEAYSEYEVVGEIANGDLKLFNEDEMPEEDDYSEFFEEEEGD